MRITQQTNVTPYQPGGTVIINFPLGVTYEQMKVVTANGLLASHVDLLTLKVNGKITWQCGGADLVAQNLYDGKNNDAQTIWLDFTQQNAKTTSVNGTPTSQSAEMLLAAYPSNKFQAFTLELAINSAAPALGSLICYTTDNDPSNNPFVLKELMANYAFTTAQRNDIALPVGQSGGLIKQMFLHQTNAGANGAGSISAVQVRNQGVIIMDTTPDQLNVLAAEYGKVPQAGLTVLDWYLQGLRDKILNTTRSNNVFVSLFTTGGPVNLTGYTRIIDPAGR